MSIFFTSDNHFYHTNIIKYEDRPFNNTEEMNNIMIERWNKKVKPSDSIYIVGDFIFSDGITANNLIKKLNGKKYLVKGNHDLFLKDRDFDKSLLEWVKDYYLLKNNNIKFILFHYPIQVWDCKHHDSIHLYGHVHSNKDNHHPLLAELGNAYNVGVDVNNYEPVALEEILTKLKGRFNLL
jgi:calcineurin-like phosphoesterase family protein